MCSSHVSADKASNSTLNVLTLCVIMGETSTLHFFVFASLRGTKGSDKKHLP